ncbi:hypothetical protein MM236_10105 [Belliella sp. DSM 107340]|uniref:Hemolytic protein HlpA-like protein n=1 Tax=Belliella calami TaxID=2923436 RepID=A0ABS9UPF7_9BACT|nr:hypothetical protein [Belliella calami]MCH7398344.1 hypothetical protein [Belliella calami]
MFNKKNEAMFDIPIVIFLFRRKETVFKILDRIREVKPKKVYLLSDGGRNPEENVIIDDVRKSVEKYIDWDCEIVKKYSSENIGVYANIGKGASWVLKYETSAIFLEDDNLPELTFFAFCKEMLEKYESNEKLLWIVGTNYLGHYEPKNKASYMFTQHMLPCGWASWSKKFNKYYDGELKNLDEVSVKNLKARFNNISLYNQETIKYFKTKYTLQNSVKLASWDSQIGFSLRHHNLLGICPKFNQIQNIGIDLHSTHGAKSIKGNSAAEEMTRRFCTINTAPLEFPLNHPKNIEVDYNFEKKIDEIVLMPRFERLKISLMTIIKPLLGINKYASFKRLFKS